MMRSSIDILLWGTLKSWQREMDRQGFDPLAKSLTISNCTVRSPNFGNGTTRSGNTPVCQPRGPCASLDDIQPVGSECSVLICYSHNSHSLFNYSVDSWPWAYASRLWALKRFYCAILATATQAMYHRSGTEYSIRRYSSVMVILYIVQDSLLLRTLLVITEWISNTLLHRKSYKRLLPSPTTRPLK